MDELKILSSTRLLDQTTLPTKHQPQDRVYDRGGGVGFCRCTILRICTFTSGSSAGRAFLHVGHALPPAATNSCRHLWSTVCPHGSVTGSSSTSKHTAQLQSSWISGRACARRCWPPPRCHRGLLPWSWLRRWYAPWYARGSPLTLPGKLAEGCGTAHRRRGCVYERVCRAGGVRELHPSCCTTQVYGTMQALFLAQVCSLRTHVSLWGTHLHESQHHLLVARGSSVQLVLLERLRSAPACSSARVTSTGQTSLLYTLSRLS
jgi:hypothetical protein